MSMTGLETLLTKTSFSARLILVYSCSSWTAAPTMTQSAEGINLYVQSDEAVIGELECAAYYHQLMICSKSKVAVISPMCIANAS